MSDFLDRIYLGALSGDKIGADTQKRIYDYAVKQRKYDLLDKLFNHKDFDKSLVVEIVQLKDIKVLSLYLFSHNRENKEIVKILKSEKRKNFLEQCIIVEKNLGNISYELVYQNYKKYNIPFLEQFIYNKHVSPKLKKVAYVELLNLSLEQLAKNGGDNLSLIYEDDNDTILHEPLRELLMNELKYFPLWSMLNNKFSKIVLDDLIITLERLLDSDLPVKEKIKMSFIVLNKLLSYEKITPQICHAVDMFNVFLDNNPDTLKTKDPLYVNYLKQRKIFLSKNVQVDLIQLQDKVEAVLDDVTYLAAVKLLSKFSHKYEAYLFEEVTNITYRLLSKTPATPENYFLIYDYLPELDKVAILAEKITSPKMLGYVIAGGLSSMELIELKTHPNFKEILDGFLELTYKEVGYLDYQLYEEGIISEEILKTFPIEMIKYASLFNNVESILLSMLEKELLTQAQWDVVESMADDFSGSFKELLEMAKNI